MSKGATEPIEWAIGIPRFLRLIYGMITGQEIEINTGVPVRHR
jgi:hypothetical protein